MRKCMLLTWLAPALLLAGAGTIIAADDALSSPDEMAGRDVAARDEFESDQIAAEDDALFGADADLYDSEAMLAASLAGLDLEEDFATEDFAPMGGGGPFGPEITQHFNPFGFNEGEFGQQPVYDYEFSTDDAGFDQWYDGTDF